jgi:hypothetical protein
MDLTGFILINLWRLRVDPRTLSPGFAGERAE